MSLEGASHGEAGRIWHEEGRQDEAGPRADGEDAIAMPDRGLLAAVALLLAVGLASGSAAGQVLRAGTPAPDVTGEHWINSGPLTTAGLRGKVVLVEFWTFG
jgi:hypothetical protein